MSDSPAGRTAVNAHTTPFLPYDLEGPVQPEMSWLPVSFDGETQQGTYLMRMEPGAVTIAHDHPGMEEFLILEGDLVDSDGTTFGPGDFVSYEAGTHHNSWTETRLPHRRLRMAQAPSSATRGQCDTTPPRSGGLQERLVRAIETRASESLILRMRRAASSAAPSRSSRPG